MEEKTKTKSFIIENLELVYGHQKRDFLLHILLLSLLIS